MNEKPILFSAPMVLAIIERRKTMTRRVVKYHGDTPKTITDRSVIPYNGTGEQLMRAMESTGTKCPYGQPGDKLWVRESGKITAKGFTGENGERWSYGDGTCKIKETGQVIGNHVAFGSNWKSTPSIHMPRWAIRITLEVTGVRVERLQEITEGDAEAEGVVPSIVGSDLDAMKYRAGFCSIWDSINAERGYGWAVNPWVWVVSFKLLEASNDR